MNLVDRRRAGSPRPQRIKLGRLVLAASLVLLAGACTRTTMPLPGNQASPAPSGQPVEPTIVWATIEPRPGNLAVVWIDQGETLPVRETAGIAGNEVAALAATQHSLRPTGNTTALGSSQWVELTTPAGIVGWVPATSVTEAIPGDEFCNDPNVVALLDELRRVIAEEDAEGLRQLVSPKRDLILRLDFWNEEVRLPADQLAGIFEDVRSYQWGTRYASQTMIDGSFSQVIVPALWEVLAADHQRACNQLLQGASPQPASWPVRYANLNYYSLLRQPSAGGNPFNWRTWVVAFEYVEGRPYLALLLQLRPQV